MAHPRGNEAECPAVSKRRAAWDELCIKWRGRPLTGKYAHACDDWDGLPIDETCENEWPCACFKQWGEKMFGTPEGEPE